MVRRFELVNVVLVLLAALVAFFCVAGVSSTLTGCSIGASAPRSLTHAGKMAPEEWAAFIESSAGWSSAAGYSAVKFGGLEHADIERFCVKLEADGFGPQMFERAAAAAELVANPIVAQLLREAQALVNVRVDFTAGERFAEWVTRVHLAMIDGALRARSEVQR